MPVKINTSKNKTLAKKYGIRGLPTILFINADGEAKDSVVGFKSAKDFAQALDNVLAGEVRRAKSAARKKSAGGKEHASLALALALAGEAEEAEAALTKARVTRYKGPILGRACNALGDHMQAGKAPDKAIKYYRSADRSGQDLIARAYAKCQLLGVYRSQENDRAAKRVARALMKLKGAPEKYVKPAREFLEK